MKTPVWNNTCTSMFIAALFAIARYGSDLSAISGWIDKEGVKYVCVYNGILLLFSHQVMSGPATPWIAARHASLSYTISWNLLKLTSIELMMSSNRLILCCPHLLPSIVPCMRVFSKESVLCIGWPKCWNLASASVLPMNIQGWFPLGLTGLISLPSKGLSRVFASTTIWKHLFFVTQPSVGPTFTSIHKYLQNHRFHYTDLCRQS